MVFMAGLACSKEYCFEWWASVSQVTSTLHNPFGYHYYNYHDYHNISIISVIIFITVWQSWWLRGKVSASRTRNLRVEPIFPWSSHTDDLKISTLVATLPRIWQHRASATTVLVYYVTGWASKFVLQLLSQCASMYNCVYLGDSLPITNFINLY